MALLAASDDTSGVGRRDHAILVMLVRLGLRAGEVAGLSLDDIDWRAGEIIVSGKGARTERLPLPVDVGEALVAYLEHGRPKTSCRALFLRADAPLGLSASAVWRRSCGEPVRGLAWVRSARIGCATARPPPCCGPGRRSMRSARCCASATRQVTAHYAKVDFVALRQLAAPWPGDAA